MLPRDFAALLLVALAASIIPGSLAQSRFDYACAKRCMGKLPEDGWQPLCVLDRPGREATMVPSLCVWKECARDYKNSTRWYDRVPVDCTSRVGCSLLYQADMRCKAAWEKAANGSTAAKPEAKAVCNCPAELPRNKRWFGGSFEPACGKPKANTDFLGGDVPDSEGGTLFETGVKSMADCCQACKNVAACHAYTWDKKASRCYLKEASGWRQRRRSGLQSARLVDPDA